MTPRFASIYGESKPPGPTSGRSAGTFKRASSVVACIRKAGSNPPVCGVHNVKLVRKQLPAELIAVGYKGSTFLVCPVSGSALNDTEKHKKLRAAELEKHDRRTSSALTVACPICKEPPGVPCFRKSNDGVKIVLLQPHAKRVTKKVLPVARKLD
jgi:hypothetical protein